LFLHLDKEVLPDFLLKRPEGERLGKVVVHPLAQKHTFGFSQGGNGNHYRLSVQAILSELKKENVFKTGFERQQTRKAKNTKIEREKRGKKEGKKREKMEKET